MRNAERREAHRSAHSASIAWRSMGMLAEKASKIAREVTMVTCWRTAEMAERRATFLRSGSAVVGGNLGNEMVGAEGLEPKVTGVRESGWNAALTAAGENLTMVGGWREVGVEAKEAIGYRERISTGIGAM